MVQVLRRVNVQCEVLQRSQVLEGLGFLLSCISWTGSAVGLGWLWAGDACQAQLSPLIVDGYLDRHSRSWVSSGGVSVSSLVAQSAVSVKQTLLRCFSSTPHLQVSIAFCHLENTAGLCMVTWAQGFASDHAESPGTYLWLQGFCLS